LPARLFTLTYGDGAVHDRGLYLAYSALARRRSHDLCVHVYTTAPEAYAPVAQEAVVTPIAEEELRRWRGPHDFKHRTKPCLVRELARRYPGDKILFLDADTFLLQAPEAVLARIGPARTVMHAREHHLLDRSDAHMRNFSRRLGRVTFRGAPVDVDHWMWNSGAVGLAPTDFDVIDEWLAFIDEVWPQYPRWIVEQYGLALPLQLRGEISACDDVVTHYWFQSVDYTATIQHELELLRPQPLPEALDHIRRLPVHVPYQVPPKVRMPLWRKWRRSLLGDR
jgi:hypothetical protein